MRQRREVQGDRGEVPLTLLRSQLDPHQLKGVEWIKAKPRCALLWDVGVQKTATALTAFVDLKATFDSRRLLVIGPKRVARKGWRREIETWEHTKDLHVSTIVGDADECLRALRTPADVHTINRERIQWLYAQFVQHGKQTVRWPWDMVVLDEAHNYRNASGIRWKQVEALRKLFPRLVLLSGTLTPNGMRNAWAPMYLLDGGQRLGTSEDGYLKRYFSEPKYEYGKYTLKAGALEEITQRMADLCYVLRTDDVMTLPPVVLNPVMVELSTAALNQYRKLKREFVAEIGGTKLKAANSAALQGKLLQLANGAFYTEDRKVVEFHEAKLDALEELLDSLAGKQVLIVYAFIHDKDRIMRRLGGRCRILSTDQDEDDWNAGSIEYMLIHPDSAGEGTNLHFSAAEDIVWFGGTNNLLSWLQTNGRLFGGKRRLGKKGTVHVLLADDTIDEVYRELIEAKDIEQEDFKRALGAAAVA